MGFDKLLEELRLVVGSSRVKPTIHIAYSYMSEAKTLHLTLAQGVTENMQADSAAFEGWALAFYANLPHLVKHVTLEWPEPKLTKASARHYHRFLYRVHNFAGRYDWFSVPNQTVSWESRRKEQGWQKLLLNDPGDRDVVTGLDQPGRERDLELKFSGDWEKPLIQVVKRTRGLRLSILKGSCL